MKKVLMICFMLAMIICIGGCNKNVGKLYTLEESYDLNLITKYDLIKNSIVQILIICVVSFVVTFAVTAYTVTFVMKIQERFRRKRIGSGDEC